MLLGWQLYDGTHLIKSYTLLTFILINTLSLKQAAIEDICTKCIELYVCCRISIQ